MKQRMLTVVWIAVSALVLTFVLLLLDFVSVRFLSENGLVFNIHCYFYGLTFLIASGVFAVGFRKVCSIGFVIAFAIGCAAIWWSISLYLLMLFHIWIGGAL